MEFLIIKLCSEEAPACEDILRALPDWFGIEDSIRSYRLDIETMETFAAKVAGEIVGFVTVKVHNPESAEIQVMGIRREYHRQGIGRAMLAHVESNMQQRGIAFLHLKTLGPSDSNQSYVRTRLFYKAMGFMPLEETTSFWGEENPCLIMVKRI